MNATDTPPSAEYDLLTSDAHIIVVGGSHMLAAYARDRIDELENRWSRFRSGSEVSELNLHRGVACGEGGLRRGQGCRSGRAWCLP